MYMELGNKKTLSSVLCSNRLMPYILEPLITI